jgi:hypothetical protein
MNRKQFTLLIVLVAIIGGIGFYLFNRNAGDWQSSGGSLGQKALGDFQINDVAQISIRQNSNEVNLVKANDRWGVKERSSYPANFADISDFVRKAADLKAVQTMKVGQSQRPRLELLEPGAGTNSGTLVELKDASGKSIRRLLLGKKHVRKGGPPSQFGDEGGFPDGRYILNLDGSKDVVSVVSDPLTQIEPKADQWLNKDFVKIENPKIIELVSTNSTNSWKISRETESGEWVLDEPKGEEKLDQPKVSSMGSGLASPTFSDVVVDADPQTTGLAQANVLNVTTFDGLTYSFKVGSKSGEDNYYASVQLSGTPTKERTPGKDEKPEDKEKLDKEWKDKISKLEEKAKNEKAFENWVFLIPRWTMEPFLKARHELLVEKKEEPKPAANAGEDAASPPPGLPTAPTIQ